MVSRETHLKVSKTSSFAYSCDDWCGWWPLRAGVWMYELNTSLRCIYTRWSLSSHQRWRCRAGSCATGPAEWSSNRKRNFSFGDQIKMSGKDAFDISHLPQTWQNDFFLKFVQNLQTNDVMLRQTKRLKPVSRFSQCIAGVYSEILYFCCIVVFTQSSLP